MLKEESVALQPGQPRHGAIFEKAGRNYVE
jgi:hypothetical protein